DARVVRARGHVRRREDEAVLGAGAAAAARDALLAPLVGDVEGRAGRAEVALEPQLDHHARVRARVAGPALDEAGAAAVDQAAEPGPGGPGAARRRAQRHDEVARGERARAAARAVPGDDARRVRSRRKLRRAEGEAVRAAPRVAALRDARLARKVRAGVGA